MVQSAESQTTQTLDITDKTRFTRARDRASYDVQTIHDILDDGLLCHIGFAEGDQPVVLPTAYVRQGNRIIIHGAVNGRFFQSLADGAPCCVTVSHLDGMVLARSAFHHSVNYRCVMMFGQFVAITDPEEKLELLDVFVEGCIPGRTGDNIRPSSKKELNATAVLVMDISQASAKIRTGPPKDDKEDMSLPVWAGVVQREPPRFRVVTDPDCMEGIAEPDYVSKLTF